MKPSIIAACAAIPVLVGVSLGYGFAPKHVQALSPAAGALHVEREQRDTHNKHELHDYGDADTEEVEIVRTEHAPTLDVRPNPTHTQTMQGRQSGRALHLMCAPPEAMSAVPHGVRREAYGHVQKCEWM